MHEDGISDAIAKESPYVHARGEHRVLKLCLRVIRWFKGVFEKDWMPRIDPCREEAEGGNHGKIEADGERRRERPGKGGRGEQMRQEPRGRVGVPAGDRFAWCGEHGVTAQQGGGAGGGGGVGAWDEGGVAHRAA